MRTRCQNNPFSTHPMHTLTHLINRCYICQMIATTLMNCQEIMIVVTVHR